MQEISYTKTFFKKTEKLCDNIIEYFLCFSKMLFKIVNVPLLYKIPVLIFLYL